MSKPIIIGLVGPIASGKGVVANFLKQQGFRYESLSDRLREDLLAQGIPVTRENLQNYGNSLREAHGNNVLAVKTIEHLQGELNQQICIDSIRNPGELFYLRETLGALIIGIDAPEEQRLEWYLKRAVERGEDKPTPEDFYIAAARDKGVGENLSGQQVDSCLALSDIVLMNDGSKETLLESLSEIVGEFHSSSPERSAG